MNRRKFVAVLESCDVHCPSDGNFVSQRHAIGMQVHLSAQAQRNSRPGAYQDVYQAIFEPGSELRHPPARQGKQAKDEKKPGGWEALIEWHKIGLNSYSIVDALPVGLATQHLATHYAASTESSPIPTIADR